MFVSEFTSLYLNPSRRYLIYIYKYISYIYNEVIITVQPKGHLFCTHLKYSTAKRTFLVSFEVQTKKGLSIMEFLSKYSALICELFVVHNDLKVQAGLFSYTPCYSNKLTVITQFIL